MTTHPLRDYCALLRERDELAAPLPELPLDSPVALACCDSSAVVPGTLFLCKGAHLREEYLLEAQRRGALAYLSERPYPSADIPWLPVREMRRTLAPVADLYYGHPSERLKVIGITGTKGKSTTAYYLKSILDVWMARQGRGESGVISSIDTWDGVERFESHLTTPEPFDLQRHFANALSAGIQYLTMEVSSQALKYHRSLCTRFAAACFLNISPDHISPVEHPDFEDYFSSKLRIFAQAEQICVNLDCDRADEVLAAARHSGSRLHTFSQRDSAAELYADAVVKEDGAIRFHLAERGPERWFRLTMPGLFNVENALAAIALSRCLEVPEDCIMAGLERARVPGRMEVYTSADRRVTALVDYAHNRLSFETLFRSVRAEYPGQRIVAVFGCPGGKAFDRREDLGRIAGEQADQVILTEEDSGEEDIGAICREIASYVRCPCLIEPNRGEAIRRAILDCREPSVLLITGKGAETRQKRGREYVDCPSDVEYVQTFLREYDMAAGEHRTGGEDLGKA